MAKLTLGYPAYRRPDLLAGALRAVAQTGRGDEVEVLICDDSTERVNELVAAQACDAGLTVRYVNNEINLGIDTNIKQCFDLASTEYCWVIGEDDWITPEGLNAVLAAIDGSAKSIYFADYVYCSNDYRRILSNPLFSGMLPASAESILARFHRLGFVGAFIIRKDLWAKISPLAPLGTYYHHLSVIGYALFALNAGVGYVDEICIKNRAQDGKSASWVEQALAVHFGYYRALEFFEPHLTAEQRRLLRASSKELFRPYSLTWLLSKRADGAFASRDVERWYSDQPAVRQFLYRIVALTPARLASFLKAAYAMCRRLAFR